MRLLMTDQECIEVLVGSRSPLKYMGIRLFISGIILGIRKFIHEWQYLFQYNRPPTYGIVCKLTLWLMPKETKKNIYEWREFCKTVKDK